MKDAKSSGHDILIQVVAGTFLKRMQSVKRSALLSLGFLFHSKRQEKISNNSNTSPGADTYARLGLCLVPCTNVLYWIVPQGLPPCVYKSFVCTWRNAIDGTIAEKG